jgi:effector-binding domain-containing protein
MKALKIIGVIILVILAVFLVVALFLPKGVSMQDSIVINKPASLIYKQVNNFHNWDAWSPFMEMDSTMKNTYEGPASGVGAKNSWTGKGGNGSMTITEADPYKKVLADLDFGQKSPGLNRFEFEELPEGTKVTWGVEIGDMGYPLGRYIGMMMPGMMEPVFKKGLENLKKVTEGMPDPPMLEVVEIPEMKVVAVVDSCSWSEIGTKMGEMFGELMTYMQKTKIDQTGYPVSAYQKWDEVNQFTVFENWIPVGIEVPGKGRVQYKVVPATKAVKGVHFGSYEKTMYLYLAMDEYMADFGLEQAGGPREEYVTDPMMEPDTSKWQTNIYFPVK